MRTINAFRCSPLKLVALFCWRECPSVCDTGHSFMSRVAFFKEAKQKHEIENGHTLINTHTLSLDIHTQRESW